MLMHWGREVALVLGLLTPGSGVTRGRRFTRFLSVPSTHLVHTHLSAFSPTSSLPGLTRGEEAGFKRSLDSWDFGFCW